MRLTLMFLTVLVLTTPTFAQLALTDTCSGQPTGTSSDMGPIQLVPAIPATAQDNLDTTGTGCANLTGFDAVTCFVAESACSATFTISPNLGGSAFASVNVTVQAGTASCENTVTTCAGGAISPSGGNSATTPTIAIGAGQLVCVYTASTAANSATLVSSGTLANCGALPVEVQSFTVE